MAPSSKYARFVAAQIANYRLLICEGYGHSAYEEYPDFNVQVLSFLAGEPASAKNGEILMRMDATAVT